jgi:nitrogen fixation NifU-like protein
MVGAPACGDVMKLQIKVNKDGIIEDARFKTYGCGSAIASSSLVTEWVKGKKLDEAAGIKNTQIAEELSLPPVKIHCSILAEDAIKAAVEDYRRNTNNHGSYAHLRSRHHVQNFLAKRGKGVALRLGVRTTGCSAWPTRSSTPTRSSPTTSSSRATASRW